MIDAVSGSPIALGIGPGVVRRDEPRTVEVDVRAVGAAGFRAVSLGATVTDRLADEGRAPTDLPLILQDAGVVCRELIGVTFRRGGDPAVVDPQVEQLLPLVELLPDAWVLLNPFTRITDASLARLDEVATRITSAGSPGLALELAPETGVESVAEARDVCEQLGADRCRVMIDTWHFSRGPSTWEDLEALPLDLLAYVQFTDGLPSAGGDVLAETMRRTWPGDGDIDLTRFASTLRTKGFEGPVIVEVLSNELQELPLEEYLRRAYESTAPFWS